LRREFLQLLLQPRTFVKFSQVLLETVATRSIGRVTLLLLLLLLLLAHGFFAAPPGSRFRSSPLEGSVFGLQSPHLFRSFP
jgi:hypothetical protein